MKIDKKEKDRQDNLPWSRSTYHSEYNKFLAFYKVKSCLENAHGQSALDLACGDGILTALLKPHFNHIVGVDASSVHLTEARKRLPDVEFHESLIEDLELKETFDSVFMLDVLEHVNDPILVLQKAASLLKEDGVFIVHVPNADAINRKIAVLMGTLESCEELSPFDINIVGHRRSYILKSFIEDIEKAGLKAIKTGGIFYKMLSTPQIDWFLKNGLWEEADFGWGRVGGPKKDWKAEFCRACYEIGKERPEDCNIIYAVIQKPEKNLISSHQEVDIIKASSANKFDIEKLNNIQLSVMDSPLRDCALDFMIKSAKYKYTYNFSWLGRPIIQFPQDILAMQEIVWEVKPDLIIETGIAHGGSLIFYASLLELIGEDGKVLGIDIDIREQNRIEIENHVLFKRIKMIQGSSIDGKIVQQAHDFAKNKKRILVVLDSNHTHDHVLKELLLYSPLVTKDSYLVVFDTVIEDVPPDFFPDRPWSKGNNPKTAVREFLKRTDRFVIDKEIENKLLITVAPDGYLKCVKD